VPPNLTCSSTVARRQGCSVPTRCPPPALQPMCRDCQASLPRCLQRARSMQNQAILGCTSSFCWHHMCQQLLGGCVVLRRRSWLSKLLRYRHMDCCSRTKPVLAHTQCMYNYHLTTSIGCVLVDSLLLLPCPWSHTKETRCSCKLIVNTD
jgi:hypothetical protein